MERGIVKSLNAVTATPCHWNRNRKHSSRLASCFFHGSRNGAQSQRPITKFPFPTLSFQRLSHFCSTSISNSERVGDGNSLPVPGGVCKAALCQPSQDRLLQVVLVSPQIPGNVGCIARTCAASAVGLHLVGPLGFKVDDTKLKRAGLDYWPYVVVRVHPSWVEFQDYFKQQEGKKRLLAFTKRGTNIHSDFSYRKGDHLIFGSETCGLPSDVLLECKSETFGGGTIRIPMVDTYVRCLNLSVSVGIALYEASRQLNYEQLQVPSGNCSEQSFLTEDIFA